jgi:hypothetical protein
MMGWKHDQSATTKCTMTPSDPKDYHDMRWNLGYAAIMLRYKETHDGDCDFFFGASSLVGATIIIADDVHLFKRRL